MADAFIATETGRTITARSRVPGEAHGELVFTTAYTGYEESLTDPSYEEQVLTFSYPLVGNYGVREERFESDRVHPRAVVSRELTDDVADVDRNGRTNVDGCYAVGWATRSQKIQAIISAGDGAAAALDILSDIAGEPVHDFDVVE